MFCNEHLGRYAMELAERLHAGSLGAYMATTLDRRWIEAVTAAAQGGAGYGLAAERAERAIHRAKEIAADGRNEVVWWELAMAGMRASKDYGLEWAENVFAHWEQLSE